MSPQKYMAIILKAIIVKTKGNYSHGEPIQNLIWTGKIGIGRKYEYTHFLLLT